MDLSTQATDALAERAAAYDGTVSDILAITPDSLTSEDAILAFWDERHLSHILPQSDYPELANNWSNIIPEDPSANLSRGDAVMSPDELHDALLDNEMFASAIEHHLDWLPDILNWF